MRGDYDNRVLAAEPTIARPSTVESTIVHAIAAHGYGVVPAFVTNEEVSALRGQAHDYDGAGAFVPAAVGRDDMRTVRPDIRGDRLRWIDADSASPIERHLFATFDRLRLALNGALQLGLFELEAHYAIYPPGRGYATHVDRFRDDDARMLSLVLYLNEQWREADGGALRLTLSVDRTIDIVPDGGTLVAFLSERFPHEVLPATRERMSIAGWFRRRA